MPTCSRCTRTIPDDATSCPFCGRAIHGAQEKPKEDLLYSFRLLLKKEQQGWRVFSMVFVVVTVVFLAVAAFSFLSGEMVATVLWGILALYSAVALLVNAIQFSRMEESIEGIYIDCTPAMERSERNGFFLLGIFFNPLTASRFLQTKAFIHSHHNELMNIIKEQDKRYESTFRSDHLHSSH